jgi:hypothetical protein
MPYVKCPSCEVVSYATAGYATVESCSHCGAGLPVTGREVVLLGARVQAVRNAPSPPGPMAPGYQDTPFAKRSGDPA